MREEMMREREAEECECDGGFHGPLKTSEKYRRKKEMEKWEGEQIRKQEPFVMCQAMSPISYVGAGIILEPLTSASLRGISIVDLPTMQGEQEFVVELISTNGLGTISVELSGRYRDTVGLAGQDSSKLKLYTTMNITDMNKVLKTLVYKSSVYDIDARDVIEVRYRGFSVHVHVHVKREPFPRLFDVQDSDDITKKVTVITKTFMRYGAVRTMIDSVHKYYPNMTIIVADDSEHPQKIAGNNVKHFIMPFAEGWFAGRNLALSQVRTPYFFILDDDMLFCDNTKLESLLKLLEDPKLNIDVVSARMENTDGQLMKLLFTTSIFERGNSKDGYCVNRVFNARHSYLDEYPDCELADEIPNAFLGRTLSVRSVGFDPMLDRVGHYEFLFDAMGKLKIASCKNVRVRHAQVRTPEYDKYRYADGVGKNKGFGGRALYSIYKNNLKCMSGMRQKGPHYM
uniref:Beta-1,4 N-acetylgalactosaminyltransferase 1-like n=1 Tax=Saccoglossus kowalevskii TaxID=10224 RepID=A0ABM0GUS1_SACKO|nr:PREDICTED: beta-1,4 N-acetylgalactosaminyltransferase 1-like [Saccoglossus kowalevskii]